MGERREDAFGQDEEVMCDHGGRGESKVATSQGIPGASGNWKRRGMNSFLHSSEGVWLC